MGRTESLPRFPITAVTERLLDWHDAAVQADRQIRAQQLLLAAWRAYDQPDLLSARAARGRPTSPASRKD